MVAAAVTGAAVLSLRLASSFSVSLSVFGAGSGAALRLLSFLPLSLSVPLPLWYWVRCDPVKLGRLSGMGGWGWFDASRPDDPDCMVLYGLHNFRCPVLYSLAMGKL